MEEFWNALQYAIEETCSAFDKTWQKRKRKIDSHFLVIFILKLVISKNSQGYASILEELWEHPIISQIQTTPFAASSVCEARQKLSPELFKLLSDKIIEIYEQNPEFSQWKEHRIFSVDGSKINLPRNLINFGYKAPHKYQYYPKGLMSTLYHLNSGLIYDGILCSDKSERMCLLTHMDKLVKNDIVILDRGYFSYLLLYKAIEKNIHLVFRMQSGNLNSAVQDFWDSESTDQIITYNASSAAIHESKKQGYPIKLKPIKLRLIKYFIDGEAYVCATTLIDQVQYPLDCFAPMYHSRWGIEELYKVSKCLIEVEDFHGSSEFTVRQECYAHMLLINIARVFESYANNHLANLESNNSNQKDSYWRSLFGIIKTAKINFKNCLLVIGRSIINLVTLSQSKPKQYLEKILKSVARVKQKIRPGRHFLRQSRKPINKWKDAWGRKVPYA